MTDSALHRRLFAGLAAVLLLVMLVVVVAWRNAQQAERTAEWVAHTRAVLADLEHVLRLNVDAQTGLRGYLITGDEQFLGPYLAARRELPVALQRLAELTADNPGQRQAVLALQRLVSEHIGMRERLVAVARARGIEAARREFAPLEASRLVDRIRAATLQLRSEEERLLTQREEASRDAARRSLAALAVLAALILAVVFGAFVVLRRHLAARLRAEHALRDSEQRLSVTLQSIGDAVLATDTHGRVTRMNPVAERLTGWSAAEAAGKPIADVFRIINEETRRPAVIPVERVL
ncbi:MAG: CHASE3 domain-containing protein, partial [Pseudomonadota bacterium]